MKYVDHFRETNRHEGSNLFSTNMVAVRILDLGAHEIVLWLDDTFPLGTNGAALKLDVIAPAEAVGIVMDLLTNAPLAGNRRQPLWASLNTAAAAFARADFIAGANQLDAFENKVRAQIAPSDPLLAESLLQAARTVIEGVDATGGGQRGWRFQSVTHQAGVGVRVRLVGAPGRSPIVEASTNLVNWQKVGVAVDHGNGTFDFLDVHAGRFHSRFYRLVSP